MAMLKIWDAAKQQWLYVRAPESSGFSSVKLGEGDIYIDADKPNDILQILGGDHVEILPNETFDSVVITVPDIGILENLPTVTKDNLVNALIELNNKLNNHGYTHKQLIPESVWTITHNLNRFPSVSVTDSGGNLVVGDVNYINNNTIQLSFSAEFAGKAYLN